MGRTRRIRFNRLGASNWADSDSDGDDDAANAAAAGGAAADGSAAAGAAGARAAGAAAAAAAAAAPQRPVRYLCYFAQSLLDFRLAEIEALAAMAGASPGDVTWEAPASGDLSSPFWFATFPSRRVARFVAERAVLLRALIEVWGEAPDWPRLRAAVEAYPAARRARHLGPDTSFRIKIDTWNFKWKEERKGSVLDALDFVGFQGPVDLSADADASFWVILAAPPPPGQGWDAWYRERQAALAAAQGRGQGQQGQQGQRQEQAEQQQQGQQQQQQEHQQQQGQQQQEQQQEQQQQGQQQQGAAGEGGDPWTYIYFGREVALAESRALPSLFSLKKRRYLGPTSMDAEMAFVMANMAWVRKGHLVFDPFCGTGSVLLAAAKRGAHVLGGDIDMRVIKRGNLNQKTGAPEDNFSNFEQYGLQWPAGLLRMDASRPPFRAGLGEILDAIVCDPPYGVRAGGRKSAPKDVEVRDPDTHFVATAPYGLTECVDDLVDLGARLLRPGGRLVFFVPVTPDTYDPSDFPDHPAMSLVGNCEQPLSGRYSRRLLTFQKAAAYDAAAAAAWRAARRGFLMGIEKVPDLVWEPSEVRTKAERRDARREAKAARRQGGGGGGCGEAPGAGAGAAAPAAAAAEEALQLAGAGV